MRALIACTLAVLVAGCELATSAATPRFTPGPAAPATSAPAPTPTPTPLPTPMNLDVSFSASDVSIVGGSIVVDVTVVNRTKVNQATLRIQLANISDYAEPVGCKPACAVTNSFGIYADFAPGVPAGKTRKVTVELIPTHVGAPRWMMCVYDDAGIHGHQVACGDIITVIR